MFNLQWEALCKHVSFYSPWYFSFVFRERSPHPKPTVGVFADLRGGDRLQWLLGWKQVSGAHRDGRGGTEPGQEGIVTVPVPAVSPLGGTKL